MENTTANGTSSSSGFNTSASVTAGNDTFLFSFGYDDETVTDQPAGVDTLALEAARRITRARLSSLL